MKISAIVCDVKNREGKFLYCPYKVVPNGWKLYTENGYELVKCNLYD